MDLRGSRLTVATCSLNQWSLDFGGNRQRILQSIRQAKALGASLRIGPELEISGYGCNDHFSEIDTFLHSWEVLKDVLTDPDTANILCDVGMPVMYRNVAYNCRVIFFNGRILLIRPKLFLAVGGNYRENRWFTAWTHFRTLDREFILPDFIRAATGQATTSFGDGVIATRDTVIGVETCEELFTPDSPHIHMALDGVEIFTNGSGSHHELRKLYTRVDLIREGTRKSGGVYLYANQQGCDGERVYYDGCAMIACNGDMLTQGSQFSLTDVEVVAATVDLDAVRAMRASFISRSVQAANAKPYPRVVLDISLADLQPKYRALTLPRDVRYLAPEEEIELGPACWLWDYLRRSGMAGYFLPLSGGADSAAVACIVFSMCRLVHAACVAGDPTVLADVRRLLAKGPDYVPASPQEVCGALFHTAYLGTVNSSAKTRQLAQALADQIGSYHATFAIDTITSAIVTVFSAFSGKQPQFKVHGGTHTENIALQNIQARVRMVMSYLLAQLLPWHRGQSGTLLVLGSSNVDESLRGYLTKYDCSAADVNPIGSISKLDLRAFMRHFQKKIGGEALISIVSTPATAELEPITATYTQVSEDDMGMTFEELSMYGRLRKIARCGPYAMYLKLADIWRDRLSLPQIADKVKFFFRMYAINRHKCTVLPPAYHAEAYSPDDNRFDLRPFLYNAKWTWQFDAIDRRVREMAAEEGAGAAQPDVD
eukprot:m.24499 g.24499  ORF g.24499 m.24499 type:complete len:713 (+) comp4024_c0_seq2:1253-3391(+)